MIILSAVFFLGAVLLKNSQALPNCHIANLIPRKLESVFLTGVIDTDPVYRDRNVSFILKVEKVKIGDSWQKSCGKILVKVFNKAGFSYGQRLFIKGSLYRPFSFSKGFDYGNYLKNQDIYLILSVGKERGMIKQLGRDAGNFLISLSLGIKHRLRKVIVGNLSAFSAGILNALILGDRQDLSPRLLDILMKLGTIHILPRLYTKMPPVAL